ncbi:hypothetical protein [Mesorhizobium sp. M2C.T.Ca.TU.002.02.1.1]|uniref:hypothetical protein n=1 Tax=Mesorhizobium sp. M2C.T.Ca.TU.002.02.1.1 TaxID=2496788 RepID=UPI000FCBF56D|nr:hypothetical protein [Mesorhizobium sp. M2C.T.Ca.TU.002.02.1.1]RUU48702.1 hypothetical protein EOD07_35590 [Mesorhizobium sp. M2C.T.Ca.TU.002.02.1.1]RUU68478.1 hypothetical protein EOD04_14090 [Mesorhizobium sp. M2C.T.Ca.TU.009.01.2.1]
MAKATTKPRKPTAADKKRAYRRLSDTEKKQMMMDWIKTKPIVVDDEAFSAILENTVLPRHRMADKLANEVQELLEDHAKIQRDPKLSKRLREAIKKIDTVVGALGHEEAYANTPLMTPPPIYWNKK